MFLTCTHINRYSEPSDLGQVFTPESASSELRVAYVLHFDPFQKSPLSQGWCEILMTKMKNILGVSPLRHQHTNTDHLCESQGHIILH